MSQNLTSRFFFSDTGMTGLIFSVRESFLRSWVNNLMVFKKAVLVLLHHWSQLRIKSSIPISRQTL